MKSFVLGLFLTFTLATIIGCADNPAGPESATADRIALASLLADGDGITGQQAIDIALGRANGTPIELELEQEGGKLLFEVAVATTNGITEVEIDASNGKIIEVEEEDDDDEGIDYTLATVTLQQAINLALAEVPGDLVEAELDNENGAIRYEIAIATPDGVFEVQLDINNGAVINVEAEDEEDDDGDDDDDDDDNDDNDDGDDDDD